MGKIKPEHPPRNVRSNRSSHKMKTKPDKLTEAQRHAEFMRRMYEYDHQDEQASAREMMGGAILATVFIAVVVLLSYLMTR
jgi:hypothetical protein